MGINVVPYPTGIDFAVGKIARFLYERLYVMWGTSGMTGDMLQAYGRVYRNSVTDGFVPQWYVAGKDYNQDLFYNDKIQALFYFGLNDPMEVDVEKTTYNLSLYFFVNLAKVRPVAQPQRMDERVVRDVLDLLTPAPYGFIVGNVYRDVDNVVNRFSGSKRDAVVLNQQHQPRLCFRIDGRLTMGLDMYGDCNPPIMPQNFNTMTGAIRVQIVTTPDPNEYQTLVNGVRIPLQYPAGSTVVIPHLSGRYVFPNTFFNGNNIQAMPYNPATTTFTLADGSEFYDGDNLLIYYNENN